MGILTTQGGVMSGNTAINHYEVLHLPEDALPSDIEAAYRVTLAKIKASLGSSHPLPPDYLNKVREAYRTLSDAARREAYDQERKPQSQRREPTLEPMTVPASTPVEPVVPMTAIGDPTVTAPGEPLRFQFTGSGGDYFRIWIVNLILSVLTLGIYSAWAKVRREQFFHRNAVLAGSGFDYHGNPKAILKGRLLAWSLLALMSVSQKFSPGLYGILLLCAIPLLPWLLLRSLKFRAANTSYRGLRFRHHGTYLQSFVAFVGHGIPTLIAGLWMPMWMRAIKRFQLGEMAFGRTRFTCAPPARGFFAAYFLGGLLMIVPIIAIVALMIPSAQAKGAPPSGAAAFGAMLLPFVFLLAIGVLVRPFIQVRLANLTWNATTLGEHRFVSTQTFGGYFGVVFTNLILVALTLGLYWPWAKVREATYRLTHLAIEAPSLDAFVGDVADEKSAIGEEIADAFDLDFSL
jgi:uncharacterized membrane protein YjgN (DUF898 family)